MEASGHLLLKRVAAGAGVPAGVHLQIADRCNHACRHCYQVQGRKGEMELAEIEAILDDLAASGIFLLNVSGGEATLRDDLLDILRAARARGFALRLFTNAYTMTDELARELASIGLLGVDVSVYSDEAVHHDAITRVPGSHARTLAGIRALLAAGVRVHLKTPVTSLVPDAGERVKRLAQELGSGVGTLATFEITPREDGDRSTQALAPSPDALVAAGTLAPWHPERDEEERDLAARETLEKASCGACRDGVTVLANGDLRPCTDIVAPLGNLRERRFLELYRDSAPSFLRELTWSDVHGCRDCALVAGCHRCHASASHETGDLLGPYGTACATTIARYRAAVGAVTFLAPARGCEPDRDRELGPFRMTDDGALQAVPDVVSDEDRDRRERFPWIRPSRAFLGAMSFGETSRASPERAPRRRLPVADRGAR